MTRARALPPSERRDVLLCIEKCSGESEGGQKRRSFLRGRASVASNPTKISNSAENPRAYTYKNKLTSHRNSGEAKCVGDGNIAHCPV